jgi:hypothetical protein
MWVSAVWDSAVCIVQCSAVDYTFHFTSEVKWTAVGAILVFITSIFIFMVHSPPLHPQYFTAFFNTPLPPSSLFTFHSSLWFFSIPNISSLFLLCSPSLLSLLQVSHRSLSISDSLQRKLLALQGVRSYSTYVSMYFCYTIRG